MWNALSKFKNVLPSLPLSNLFIRAPTSALSSSSPSSPSSSPSPFVNAMTNANISLTENMGITHPSSLDPRVDLFFHLLPNTKKEFADDLFEKSWKHSPEDTLKLIFHAGSVRFGKSDKKSFQKGLLWLSQNHPKTLLHNLKHVPDTSYWKDLLLLVQRLNLGEEKEEVKEKKYQSRSQQREAYEERRKEFKAKLESLPEEERQQMIMLRKQQTKEHNEKQQEKARELRRERRAQQNRNTEERRRDPTYSAIESEVARVIAEKLKEDRHNFEEKKFDKISMCAKWAPSFKKSFDKVNGMTSLIYDNLFERSPAGTGDPKIDRKIKDSELRHAYLTPLRWQINSPEIFMCAREWDKLPYEKVPSVAMRNYKKIFLEHDKERFEQHINDVAAGKKKNLVSGALLPHQIVIEAPTTEDPTLLKVVELQWKSYVDNLKKSGNLKNILPVADVSGSMSIRVDKGTSAVDVSIALSLLVSELAEPAFKDVICTFSEKPEFHKVTGNTLTERISSVKGMKWGMNTNYQAIFDLILARAKAYNLPKDQMIKRIIVFSDMQFDESTPGNYDTDHQRAKKKFDAAGYPMPEIIYWNLVSNDTFTATPVTVNDKGVCLVSGFSGNLLKLFMENDSDTFLAQAAQAMSPAAILEKAISQPLFESLKVVD